MMWAFSCASPLSLRFGTFFFSAEKHQNPERLGTHVVELKGGGFRSQIRVIYMHDFLMCTARTNTSFGGTPLTLCGGWREQGMSSGLGLQTANFDVESCFLV